MSKNESTTWDYGVLDSDQVEDLNHFGVGGWEFVASVKDRKTWLIMKRPGLSFREEVTLDQRRRFFASRDIDIDDLDPEKEV